MPLQAADEPFVLYQRALSSGVYNAVMSLCRAAGFTPRMTQEGAVVGLIAAGMGVALVSSSQRRVPREGTESRFLEGPPAKVERVAAWALADRFPATAAFLAMVCEEGRDLTASERVLSRAS